MASTDRQVKALEAFAAGAKPDSTEINYIWRGFERPGTWTRWYDDEIGSIEKLYILDGVVVSGEMLVHIYATTKREREIFLVESKNKK